MSKLSFVKYQAIGNDFILIDDRSSRFDVPSVPSLCHRKRGIGADGVILLQNGSDFRMRIFNSDGSEAESCGNGLRCLVLFLKELGIERDLYRIQLGVRTVFAQQVGEEVAVDMGSPSEIRLNYETPWGPVHFADSGAPHAVHFVPDVEKVDLLFLAPLLRHHPLFSPRGVNVNFAALQRDRSIRVRTFERGVEGETLGCGTGAVAVAAIARKLYDFEGKIPIHFSGGTLFIEGNWMVGPAQRVFSGVIPKMTQKLADMSSSPIWKNQQK